MKTTLSIAFSLSLLACASSTAQVRVTFRGEPTPALAMYAVQTRFAAEKCVSGGFTTDAKTAAKFLKDFNTAIILKLYEKTSEEFMTNVSSFYANYSSAWNTDDGEARRRFCDGFADDIEAKDEMHLQRWRASLDYFRDTFSPLSDEFIKRQRKLDRIASGLRVGTAAATAAASISAAKSSVSSAKAGDWASSNQQMAESRSINQVGSAISSLPANAPPYVKHDLPTSVLEQQNSDGTSRVIRCPVVDHFNSHQAPGESALWITYQSVAMMCRDLNPADLKDME